ncbi:hypothetical protein P3X46_017782 [Hevea brasiliensis]|uniref:Uncharacterized protein n=1 Tax=Hevea brasiliensis TaxID=3981 RepID=A0ABQ9LSG8_HEVBR|nr:uncharacterized protein LOC110635307 [Hevea brasiliensis]KAJ9169613.1 hypothetical protein P3X46_017782 [Hevea brasiliensis]
MSCLNLSLGLPPAKKAWQNFTSKLLHKPHKSMALKKPKYPSKSSNFFEQRDQSSSRRFFFRPSKYALPFKRRRSRFLSHKKTAPVYIDKLFREPVADELVEQCPPSAKTMKFLDNHQAVIVSTEAEASRPEDGKGDERAIAADDMWESLGFASPQMRGIDERAEQFITSFRSEMEVQEMIARRLFILGHSE